MQLGLKGLKGAGRDLRSAHFEHTKKKESTRAFLYFNL